MIMYHHIMFGCQRINSSAYIIEKGHISVISALAVTLTLKAANNFFPTWHSGSWWCIIIPNLVTKCSVVQKILSGQIFINISNLHCDLYLKRSNPIFPQDTPAYNAVLSNQVWLQTDQQFRRHSRHNHILIIQALAVTLTLKIVSPFSCMALRPSLWPWHWR